MCISCLQAAKADPNHSEQKHRKTVPAVPSVPQTVRAVPSVPQTERAVPSVPQTRNDYGSDPHYFVTVKNQHYRRLCLLFPDINPARLKNILGNHIHM